ncbi:MAG TPA: hypothetical protein VJ227_01065 [Patescibacteria group bacterium]|nr:hypothetical protein [Patescibacteria group bacterium]
MDNINTGIEKIEQIKPPSRETFFSKISGKIPPKIKDVFLKFYSRKKIFWPVTISLGLLLLVVVLGLLFGSPSPAPLPTQTPRAVFVPTPEASPSGDILSVTERRLRDLKLEIDSLDLKQSHLAPLELNYDTAF